MARMGSWRVLLLVPALSGTGDNVRPDDTFHVSDNPRFTILQSARASIGFTWNRTLKRCNQGHLASVSSFVDPEGQVMGWHDFGTLEGPGWAANAVGGAYEVFTLGRFLGEKGWQSQALGIFTTCSTMVLSTRPRASSGATARP